MRRTTFLLLALFLVACGSEETAPTTVTLPQVDLGPYTTFSDDALGFSISYPASWAVELDEEAGVVTMVSDGIDSGIVESLAISHVAIPDDLPPGAWYDAERERLSTILDDSFEIIEYVDVRIDGRVGRGVTVVAGTEQAVFGISRLLFAWEGEAWEVTFVSTPARLEQVSNSVSQIFRSFTTES